MINSYPLVIHLLSMDNSKETTTCHVIGPTCHYDVIDFVFVADVDITHGNVTGVTVMLQ